MNRSATIIRLAAQVLLLWSPALRVPAQSAVPLTDHMIAQLASRTNGTACGSYGLIAGNNSFSTSPVMAANFWLAGVTNINAEGNSLANGALFPGGLTMVSPRHCVNAAHVGYSVMNVWILPGGALYTNSVLAATNDGDIQIELMARTNPFFAKIFPNATNQIGRWQRRGSGALPLFVRRHRGSNPLYWYETNPAYEPTFVSGASSLGSFTAESELRFGDYLESGDRNGPLRGPPGTDGSPATAAGRPMASSTMRRCWWAAQLPPISPNRSACAWPPSTISWRGFPRTTLPRSMR